MMDLIICVAAFVLWLSETVAFGILISKARKEKGLPVVKKNVTVCVLAFVLIALPLLVPLKTYVTAVVCGCGLAGEFAVLKDRLGELKQ